MAAPTYTLLNISQSGATPIGFVSVPMLVNGVIVQANVQAGVLLDPVTGTPSVIDGNGLHVIPSLGTPLTSGIVSNTNISSGASATLPSPVPITSGKTGTLQHAIFASTQPVLWTLQKVNNAGTPTSISSFITDANRSFDFKPGSPNEVATDQASGSACLYQATALNLSTNQATPASVYATYFWAEN